MRRNQTWPCPFRYIVCTLAYCSILSSVYAYVHQLIHTQRHQGAVLTRKAFFYIPAIASIQVSWRKTLNPDLLYICCSVLLWPLTSPDVNCPTGINKVLNYYECRYFNDMLRSFYLLAAFFFFAFCCFISSHINHMHTTSYKCQKIMWLVTPGVSRLQVVSQLSLAFFGNLGLCLLARHYLVLRGEAIVFDRTVCGFYFIQSAG